MNCDKCHGTGRIEERKYYVKCIVGHESNAWRYGDEARPAICPLCGLFADATLIMVDGEYVGLVDVDRDGDPDAHAAELERQGNEIAEQYEREQEERYAGEEQNDGR